MRKEERAEFHNLLIQELDNAQSLEEGSEEATAVMKHIDTLGKLVSKQDELDLEERKLDTEDAHIAFEIYKLEQETKLEREKLELEKTKLFMQNQASKKQAIIETASHVGLALLSTAFYGAFFDKALVFEQTGTIGATTVKNLLSGIKPPKF